MKIDKKAIIRWKIYLDRARMYLMYINFFMMVTVFINSFKDYEIGKLMNEYMIISVLIMIILLLGISLVLGYFDTKLGIRSEEARNMAVHNPVTMEILERVKEIQEKQKELEERINRNSI